MTNLNIALKKIRTLAKESILHFIFPSYCLHCKEEEVGVHILLCPLCSELIQRIPIEGKEQIKRFAAVEKEGAAVSLLKEKEGNLHSEIAKLMAAFMVIQIVELNLPSFDLVVPFSSTLFSLELAKEISSLLKVPVKNPKGVFVRKRDLFLAQTILVVDFELSDSSSFSLFKEGSSQELFYMGFCKQNPS